MILEAFLLHLLHVGAKTQSTILYHQLSLHLFFGEGMDERCPSSIPFHIHDHLPQQAANDDCLGEGWRTLAISKVRHLENCLKSKDYSHV